ncbi:MAG: octanoyltransferase [Verrucomicrobia bacterium]|nr:MAG: octanoyltransferase [Verrucomicrobiota bacterium]
MKIPAIEWLGRVPYEEALLIQEQLVRSVLATGTEKILLLEHHSVYTIGRTQDESSLVDRNKLSFPIHRINRGGQATYHGPGQLVCYPILNIATRGRDLHRYLRFLEEVNLAVLWEYGIRGCRREGLTGVWVENRKIASIGVGIRRWVSMHGFALNVAKSLPGFSEIIPCGIAGVAITSLSAEMGHDVALCDVVGTTKKVLAHLLKVSADGSF